MRAWIAAAVGTAIWMSAACADTVVCDDGKTWNGLIVAENARAVEIDLGFDVARLERGRIVSIRRSGAAEAAGLRERLRLRRLESERIRDRWRTSPKTIRTTFRDGHYYVEAWINGLGPLEMMIDTGASLTVLTSEAARRVGIGPGQALRRVDLQTADGRKHEAALVALASVRVDGAIGTAVPAAVMLEPSRGPEFKDGLLGMSYLSKFNFRIDNRAAQITLEPLEDARP